MRDWGHITADDILRAYAVERRRLCGISNAGLDDNGRMPTSAPAQDWDMVLLMVRGVPAQALDALELRYCGYQVDERASKAAKSPIAKSEWRVHSELPTGWGVEEYAAAKAMDEEPPRMITTFAGEFPFLLGNREIGRYLGITATEVKGLLADAVMTVSENVAKLKETK